MIRSMTAFASSEASQQGYRIGWEVRSVNHRYLDLSLRLPDAMRGIEADIRGRVAKVLRRGKVECTLSYQRDQQQQPQIEMNMDVVQALAVATKQIEDAFEQTRPVTALEILSWPGVQKEQTNDQTWLQEQAMQLLDQALTQMLEAREREGAKLKELIEERCERIQVQVQAARDRMPLVIQAVRERITTKVNELIADPDQERIEQELVMLAQKMDVDEEMDRLTTHVQEVRRALRQNEPVGRRLDFLMQELTREANTLGSKSNDQTTTAISIELKVLIEQMREQVQNIE